MAESSRYPSDEGGDTAQRERSENDGEGSLAAVSRRAVLFFVAAVASVIGLGSERASAVDPHDHLGETWTGDPGNHGLEIDVGANTRFGLLGFVSASNGRGLVGRVTSSTGSVIGVLGRAESPDGVAMQGQNDAATGNAYGGLFRTESSGGRGFLGIAESSTGSTFGALGRSRSIAGTGVEGNATASSGQTTGVSGRVASPTFGAAAVRASAANGSADGVVTEGYRGAVSTGRLDGMDSEALGAVGYGVRGANQAGSDSVSARGVYGLSDGTSGTGVYGYASSASGNTEGIYGFSSSDVGSGVFGETAATGGNVSTSGVHGRSPSEDGVGVLGEASADAPQGGSNALNRGVLGIARGDWGEGVSGYAANTSADAWGAVGTTEGAGFGVLGNALGSSGFNAGVYGATNSPGGYGLYTPDNAFVGGDFDVSGTKNFVESVDTPRGTEEVVYTCVEASKAHTEVTDVASLDGGTATVDLPEHFDMVTSSEDPLSVQVTPYGGDGRLVVVERSTDRIVVEDAGGSGDYDFTYTVKGTRKGYEDKPVRRSPPERDAVEASRAGAAGPAATDVGGKPSKPPRPDDRPDHARGRSRN